MFTIDSSCSFTSARAGILKTGHSEIKTPVFMPIGTYGAVKTLSSEEIGQLPSTIILSNSYHLYLRPGIEILEDIGGLHKFMNWENSILTDSGGYQIFSLQGMRKITDDGVTFQSHLDGSTHHLTPEKIVDIQRSIGSDFMMMLDVCPPGDVNKNIWIDALNKTSEWAKRSMDQFNKTKPKYGHHQIIIPIVQGGTDYELRERSANDLLKLDADAYAIGGLAVGESKENMFKVTKLMDKLLLKDKPRYLMGVGTPSDLVKCVSYGVDMFDCVLPTRNARNGQLFTFNGKINIRNSKYKKDYTPIDNLGSSTLSKNYTKSYLHHLFKTEEILGYRIATQHNLNFYMLIMEQMRDAIIKNNFKNWSIKFLKNYEQNSEKKE